MSVDDLGAYGVERMDDDHVRGFLDSQQVGVLGLGTEGAPSMRPLSYWYDGDETLYFQFLCTDGSHKEALSTAADAARFLVYRAETRYNWRSVLLTGTIDPVPEPDRPAVEAELDLDRPDALEAASGAQPTRLYAFRIADWTGIEHLGLPPELAGDGEE